MITITRSENFGQKTITNLKNHLSIFYSILFLYKITFENKHL